MGNLVELSRSVSCFEAEISRAIGWVDLGCSDERGCCEVEEVKKLVSLDEVELGDVSCEDEIGSDAIASS